MPILAFLCFFVFAFGAFLRQTGGQSDRWARPVTWPNRTLV